MVSRLGKILVVDDNEDLLLAAQLLLKQHAQSVHIEKNPMMIPSLMEKELYDVILLDMNFKRDVSSSEEGFYWLKKILEIDPLAIVVFITAYGDIEMAVRAIKRGAIDFVVKPWHNEKLLATVSAAMAIRRSRIEIEGLKSKQQQLSADLDQHFQGFIGQSPLIRQVLVTTQKVAKTDANVLILGENGTGKELVARDLHRQSLRSKEVFIKVDMAELNQGLFESELFGHVKGAFTDAREDRIGRFETASGGTLFLDEVGNLPMSLQAKLLTVLQNREITRIGSNNSRPIDIRLICATNMPITKMILEGKFRQDLLYRINTVEIQLPPLREREEDIPLLVDYYLTIYCRKYQKPVLRLDQLTMAKLQSYRWPGNIRELQHAVERAVIMSDDDDVLHASDFFFSPQEQMTDISGANRFNLDEVEKSVIQSAISKHSGNISQAAKELGLTRTALYRRLDKYGL